MTVALYTPTAEELEARVADAVEGVRMAWSKLAEALYEFREARAYEALGFPSFRAWAVSDRFSMTYCYAQHLVKVWRTLVVEQGRDPEELAMLSFDIVDKASRTVQAGEPLPAKVRRPAPKPVPSLPVVDQAGEEFAASIEGQAILRSRRRDAMPVSDAVRQVATAEDTTRRREALIDLAAAALAEANRLLAVAAKPPQPEPPCGAEAIGLKGVRRV